MFECVGSVEADLAGLLGALARVGADGESDVLRVEQLTALERVKAACAAAQARVTVDLVESQAEVARQWRARGRECSDAGDFEGWRAAREKARAATWARDGDGDDAKGAEGVEGTARCLGGDGTAGGMAGAGGAGGARERRRQRRVAGTVGVAAQVALARRVSPHRGSRCVGVAVALVEDLPWVLSQVEAGTVSERRAEIIVCETSHLTPDQRGQVDDALRECGDEVGQWGDRDLARRVKAIAYRLDAQAAVDRSAYAVTQRRVSIRPAPDCMSWVTALLPVAQGVAVHASLMRDAATTIATATISATTSATIAAGGAGDERSKGQVMADRLVELVTGHAVVGPADRVGVEVQVVITDRALLGADADEVASVRGYGPVPARWVRDLLTPRTTTRTAAQATAIREATAATNSGSTGSIGSGEAASTAAEATEATEATEARVWVRRLLTDPVDGSLTGMDTGRRLFDGALRRFLLARDETCRTPWCDAPARHADHVTPYARGGPTTATNGQGLCVRCNLTKEQPGWTQRVVTANSGDPSEQDEHTHTVETTTPTGHRHRSHAPPVLPSRAMSPVVPSAVRPQIDLTAPTDSALERALAAWLGAA